MTSVSNSSGIQSNSKLYGLDHLRALAIISVVVYHYGLPKNSILMFPLAIAATRLAAYLLNVIIEKPFLRLREKILKKDVAMLPATHQMVTSNS